MIISHLQMVVTMFLVVTFVSCNRPFGHGQSLARYREVVQSGFEKIPQSLEIEELFGEADHFITHWGMEDGPLHWNSEVYFYGRYSLTMQVYVEVDGRYGKVIRMVDEPEFLLCEYTAARPEGSGGGWGADPGEQHWLSPAEWKTLVENNGDFSAIGITVYRDRPVPGFDGFVRAKRRPRLRVRPAGDMSSDSTKDP